MHLLSHFHSHFHSHSHSHSHSHIYLFLLPCSDYQSFFPYSDVLSNRISEGQFYEAHQQLRVVASRYVKQENWVAAIDILYGGALALLKAGQGGSGGDLCLFMVDVYGKGAVDVGPESKGKYHGTRSSGS